MVQLRILNLNLRVTLRVLVLGNSPFESEDPRALSELKCKEKVIRIGKSHANMTLLRLATFTRYFCTINMNEYLFLAFKAGDYQINVKWSGEHVPNSPFNVKIFKTAEEFARYLVVSQTTETITKYDTILSTVATNQSQNN